MTLTQVVARVSSQTKVPRTIVNRVLRESMAVIRDEAETGVRVTLQGFGTFYATFPPKGIPLFGGKSRSNGMRVIRFRESKYRRSHGTGTAGR